MTSITAPPLFGKKLGSGRFASVYECTLAVDNEPPKSVAIKVYRAGEESRELFEDEVRIMQAMAITAQTLADKRGGACIDDNAYTHGHEYVALCTSAWDRAGADGFLDGTKIQYCLTFPLEPNDLRTVIDLFLKRDSASLPFGLATLIWRDLLRGLDFLRACNIVHGDIKPENILITWPAENLYKLQDLSVLDGTQAGSALPIARIADFGCARVCTSRRNAHTVGTDEYLAPEQILYLGYDTRADMWAAGCVLVELVTGDALYETDPRWMIYYGDDVAALAEELMCGSASNSASSSNSGSESYSGSGSDSTSDDSILHNSEDHAPALIRASASGSASSNSSGSSSTDLEWESLFLQLVLITKILGPAPAEVWRDAQHYYDRRGQLWGTPVEPADLASILNVNYDIEPADLRTVVTLATACMHWLPADRATPRDALTLLKKLINL